MELVIDVVDAGGQDFACVRPSGEIDLANAEEFGAAITSPQCNDAAGVLVDLTDVDFMDSSGLRVMLLSARAGKAAFATIVKEGSAVATLFDMVDVRQKLNVAATQDEALGMLRAGADATG
jgi:anti-sigma B factor antagonist